MSEPSAQPHLGAALLHLYAHVPFCPSICPYCDFHVLTRKSGMVEAYLAELARDAAQLASAYAGPLTGPLVGSGTGLPAHTLQTVYVGGGTPSFLRDAEMVQLVQIIRQHLGWGSQENTLEINPGTVTTERAKLWRDLGFDRASVGVQSLHDPTLQFLGRRHSAQQARQSIETLLEAGFRVSGDLITAVSGQPLEQDIRGLVQLGVQHVSAYTLTIEAGTAFERLGVVVSEEDERLGFERTAELLGELGFERYEISNYAQQGQQSRHNLAYWHGRLYYGLGPSAAGHYPVRPVGGHVASQPAMARAVPHSPRTPHSPLSSLTERRSNPKLSEWLRGERGEVEPIGPLDYVTDALFMGLRLRTGINVAELSQRSGVDVAQYYAPVIERQQEQGYLWQEGDWLRATPAGWWVLNKVLLDFLAYGTAEQEEQG